MANAADSREVGVILEETVRERVGFKASRQEVC